MLRKACFGAVALLLGGAAAAVGQSQGTILLPDPKEPASRVGTRGANFLEIGVGARAQGMSGAGTGLASGVTAMYWNAAGIAGATTFSAAYQASTLRPPPSRKANFRDGNRFATPPITSARQVASPAAAKLPR